MRDDLARFLRSHAWALVEAEGMPRLDTVDKWRTAAARAAQRMNEAANHIEAQQAEIARLQAWRESAMEQLCSSRWDVLQSDDVEVCRDCSGSGYQVYGTTATWRGGVGGATMTSDVCNRCWGSGKSNRPWPSHRAALDSNQ